MEKKLEVKVDVIGYPLEQWKSVIKKGEYDIVKIEYSGLFNDSMAFLEQWTSTSIFNVYGYQNKEYDLYLEKAKMERDVLKRKEFLIKCETLLVQDLPIVPVYFNTVLLCKKDNVEGIVVTTKGNIKMDRAYIK